MKITADTIVLVRAIVEDEPRQARRAQAVLREAEAVAVPTAALCELVWVLSRGYGVAAGEVAAVIQRLVAGATVLADRPAVEAGLAMMEAGGDFADGVIAHQGAWLGGEVFVSFDRAAVARLRQQGRPAQAP